MLVLNGEEMFCVAASAVAGRINNSRHQREFNTLCVETHILRLIKNPCQNLSRYK